MSKVCCFFCHKKIEKSDGLKSELFSVIKELILKENVNTFLFGSRSEFDSLCRDVVEELKNIYPNIKRIYVRAEYQYIDEGYLKYLLKSYDETYFPKKISGAGKASYIKRNYEMIDNSDFCVIYYDKKYASISNTASGTAIAYSYAKRKKKKIFNLKNGL